MRVRHFGNTANNAFHNVLLLRRYGGTESDLPIRMFGLHHAISAPAWEVVDFEVPSAAWVAQPDWTSYPEAVSVNSEYADLELPSKEGEASHEPVGRGDAVTRITAAVRSRLFGPLRGKWWSQPIVDARDRQILGRRSVLREVDDAINLLYGSGSLFVSQLPNPSPHTVCLEHGTIRWIADGNREEKAFRQAYRRQVAQAMHVWVTNLDPRTLEIAEDVAPGRWSALPHPFMPDSRVPLPGSASRRNELLRQTRSESLVLLPSSQNWSKHHDKGSIKALSAFVELRRAGVDVGLVAVEWGLQLEESKVFLDEAGVGANVVWVPPMARFGLQRMMANVDVVWDQFGLDVFGALALRAVEQGTPLVSRGLAAAGEQLIGGPVPWHPAATTEEIVRETTAVLEEMGRRGRDTVIEETRARYRSWLLERHSPALTATLQHDVYARIIDGTFEQGTAAPNQWATLLANQAIDEGRKF